MHPLIKLVWHFGGLIAVIAGMSILHGWAGALIAFGGWAVVATMSDIITERLDRL